MKDPTLVVLMLLLVTTIGLCPVQAAAAPAWTRWSVHNMRYCSGKPDQVVFDGSKSTVTVSKGNHCTLVHTIRYMDLAKDTFVLRLGKVSPDVSWDVTVIHPYGDKTRRKLMTGKGGGTHRAPFARLGFPRWLHTDLVLNLRSDTPGTAEILAWEIETPGADPNAAQHAKAYKTLVKANPLERGLVPHWNTKIGSFVCAFNATHPEHYNFWLEDTGEMLWSFGNYPDMMKLYGKGLRDFIVEYCKYGAPVRRVNNQPLSITELPAAGKFIYDTGPLAVEGDLSNDPHINLHHGTYEMSTIATLAGFHVTYEDAQGVAHKIDFTKPISYDVQYDVPKRDQATLVIRSGDEQASAEFTVLGYRGGVRVSAKVANSSDGEIRKVTAGFELRDCEKYYRSPLNSHKQFGDIAILWSEQQRLEFCTVARLQGPAARNPVIERKAVAAASVPPGRDGARPLREGEGDITRAGFSAMLADRLAKGSGDSLELANVQAGSRSFAQKIDIYKDIAFEDADISMSFVSTYALLGLGTYSYRFPDDIEARRVTDLMIDNFYGARERIRNRELAYLLWVLDLLGRKTEASTVADLLEKRAAVDSYTPLDMGGMGIALRRVGRWEAADRVCAGLVNKSWTGVAQPADFLGLGATHSPALTARALSQYSAGLRSMVWDAPDRLSFHSHATVEEAAEEAQSYQLVAYDILSRTCGGIVPVRLGLEPETGITKISYDEKSAVCKIGVTKAGQIDIYTTYRPPTAITWNGTPLDPHCWRYDAATGTIRMTGLTGDGEITVQVKGPRPKDKWTPIDYIGLGERAR